MRHKSFLRLTFVLVATSLFFSYCSKDEGAEGPQGPAGPAGPAGPQGPAGTANVIYSNWLDVPFAPDKDNNGDTLGFFADVTASKLTASILTSGEMKAYVNLGTAANPAVSPLPFLNVYTGANIDVVFLTQKISLYSNADASTYTENGAKYLQYRYILIPGGTQARIAKPDWNDYNKVKEFYGLPD